jgi:ubiquinone/menaquinone biosynthesis C-methylase UbiE
VVKLDLGCGPNKKEGFVGCDIREFPGVDVVGNLGNDPWPWEADSVDEVHCSHMLEHLSWPERVFFFNELHRVMKKGAKATIIIPHWASSRYYGDPTHKEPMSEFAFYYLLKSWRDVNAPHTDYTCDFDATWGYSVHPAIQARNPEYQQYAITWFKEAAQDLMATVIKR